jgi:hypothetical protein
MLIVALRYVNTIFDCRGEGFLGWDGAEVNVEKWRNNEVVNYRIRDPDDMLPNWNL